MAGGDGCMILHNKGGEMLYDIYWPAKKETLVSGMGFPIALETARKISENHQDLIEVLDSGGKVITSYLNGVWQN
jgi:hypothetical protein